MQAELDLSLTYTGSNRLNHLVMKVQNSPRQSWDSGYRRESLLFPNILVTTSRSLRPPIPFWLLCPDTFAAAHLTTDKAMQWLWWVYADWWFRRSSPACSYRRCHRCGWGKIAERDVWSIMRVQQGKCAGKKNLISQQGILSAQGRKINFAAG